MIITVFYPKGSHISVHVCLASNSKKIQCSCVCKISTRSAYFSSESDFKETVIYYIKLNNDDILFVSIFYFNASWNTRW